MVPSVYCEYSESYKSKLLCGRLGEGKTDSWQTLKSDFINQTIDKYIRVEIFGLFDNLWCLAMFLRLRNLWCPSESEFQELLSGRKDNREIDQGLLARVRG